MTIHWNLVVVILTVIAVVDGFQFEPSSNRKSKRPRQAFFGNDERRRGGGRGGGGSHVYSLDHRIRQRHATALFCQLLGMNCRRETDFSFSFTGFCERGGKTDIHSDGWGLSYYENSSLRQFHDTEPASCSPLAKFIGKNPVRTLNMMGHIRYATVGKVNLSNVHPFSREMWGIQWCFCHNGEVPMFTDEPGRILTSLGTNDSPCSDEKYYNPIGSTDSEATFCAILNALRVKFKTLPSLPVLYEAIQELCQEIVDYNPDGTIMNFLLSCGPHTLWAYSWPGSRPGSTVWNGLHYTVREFPFSKQRLSDMDYSVDFSLVAGEDDCVSIIATKPLTEDEAWIEFGKGELTVFDEGRPVKSVTELFQVELLGHGLHSKVLERPNLEDDMKIYNLSPSEYIGGGI
jgi:predicted glutamine amidotransferase